MDFDQSQYLLSTFIVISLCALGCRLTSSGRKNTNSPPSPPTLPILGNLHQLGRFPHLSLHHLSKKHGPLMLLHFGAKPTLVVSSPDTAKQILKTHDISFSNRPAALSTIKKLSYDLKDIINLPYGDQWKKLRSIFLHELLSSASVKSYNSIREEEVELMTETIIKQCRSSQSSSAPLNLTNMFMSLTNDLISRAAFGKKHMGETERGQRFLKMMVEASVG